MNADTQHVVHPEKVQTPYHDSLQPLLDMARRLRATLVPVQPAATFRDELHRRLTAAAQQLAVREQIWPSRNRRVEVFIGAAALSSLLSLVGLIILLVRTRLRKPRSADPQ